MVGNVQSDCVASFWQAVYAVRIHFLAGSIQVFILNVLLLAGNVQSLQTLISWQVLFRVCKCLFLGRQCSFLAGSLHSKNQYLGWQYSEFEFLFLCRQCSECVGSSSDTSVAETIEGEERDEAGRRKRRVIREPNKFTPPTAQKKVERQSIS